MYNIIIQEIAPEIVENIIFLIGSINIYFEIYIKNTKTTIFYNKRFVSLFKNMCSKEIINFFINYDRNKEILIWLKHENKIEILNLTYYEKINIINGNIKAAKFLYDNKLLSNIELDLYKIMYNDLI